MRNLTVVTCIWLVGLLYFTSDGGMSVFDVLVFAYGWLALVLAWLIVFLVARAQRRPIRRTYGIISAIVLLLGAVLYWTEGAIYLRLLPSRPALDAYVLAAQRKQINSRQPISVGAFKVRETETLKDGTVRLITASCMFDDCGLAYAPRGKPPILGEDSYDHLIGKWWHWWRSW